MIDEKVNGNVIVYHNYKLVMISQEPSPSIYLNQHHTKTSFYIEKPIFNGGLPFLASLDSNRQNLENTRNNIMGSFQ